MSIRSPKPRAPWRDRLAAFMGHRCTDWVVAALIVLSIVLLFLEFVTGHEALIVAGQVLMAIFVVELTLRYLAARSAREYLTTYWLDILSVLPLFRAWRVLRFVRLIRLLRLGPLLTRSNRRLAAVVRGTLGEQAHLFAVVVVTVLGVSLAILEVERGNPEFETFADALWWAVLSIVASEPIGGEPQTGLGRLFTLVIMAAGLTVFAVLTGTVSAIMSERFRNLGGSLLVHLGDLKDHVLICGWNRSGGVVVAELRKSTEWGRSVIVLVAERRPDNLPGLEKDPDFIFIEADYTRQDVLKNVGVERAARAILLADKSVPERSDQDRDARTLLAGLTIEKLHKGIYCSAELLSRDNQQHLVMAGIEEIVVADEFSGTLLATSSRVRGVTDIAQEVFSNQGNRLFKIPVPAGWVGRTCLEVQELLKREHHATLIGLRRTEPSQNGEPPVRRTIANPAADDRLQAEDGLVVLAEQEPKPK